MSCLNLVLTPLTPTLTGQLSRNLARPTRCVLIPPTIKCLSLKGRPCSPTHLRLSGSGLLTLPRIRLQGVNAFKLINQTLKAQSSANTQKNKSLPNRNLSLKIANKSLNLNYAVQVENSTGRAATSRRASTRATIGLTHLKSLESDQSEFIQDRATSLIVNCITKTRK